MRGPLSIKIFNQLRKKELFLLTDTESANRERMVKLLPIKAKCPLR